MDTENIEYYTEPEKRLPIKKFDVIVVGGGTSGLFAATSSARNGARTLLIESKGYCGGIAVEGGTAIHSFYNLYTAFPQAERRKVVRGLPMEFIDRLTDMGGATGYPEMERGKGYDSICTAVDPELYKVLAFRMLKEAGVYVALNTLLTGAIIEETKIIGVITESRSGREAYMARNFIDSTGFGDLCAFAGAEYTVPNDYMSAHSFGFANASIDDYYKFLSSIGAVKQLCRGKRSGAENKIIRVGVERLNLPGFAEKAGEIGVSMVTTTLHDNYLSFIKCNYKVPGSVVYRDNISLAEMELRERMVKASELFKEYVPGFQEAFISRTSPSLTVRRGRLVNCDYDIKHEDVVDGKHFPDDVFVYGFHDMAPKIQIKDGGTYGFPYRSICVKGVDNLYATGMMITSDYRAHMSTRNTVSCMAQGQAAGSASALCAKAKIFSRDLSYDRLRETLERENVYFE
jgi:hypothetical protein